METKEQIVTVISFKDKTQLPKLMVVEEFYYDNEITYANCLYSSSIDTNEIFILSPDHDNIALCKHCNEIGRNGEHSWFCRKCGGKL